MNQEPEPGAESSGESGSASSRSQKTIYYDFQFQHGDNDECYAEELNGTQPKRGGEDGTFDSGNFSETVENGSHPCPSPLFQAPLPMFTIGSPLLRRCSSSTYNTGKSRVDADAEQVNPSQESSGDSQKPNPTSTSSTSGRREATMTTRSDSYLHDLVGNFNTLYEQKLNEVAKKSIGGEGDHEYNVVQKQNAVMREWVRDLNEQNAVLIETVNDMEKEADEKIELLQVKIQRSTQMVMEHMEIIQQYEKQVQELVDQRTESDKEFEMLRSEALAMDKKRKILQDKLCALEADHASLITLMTRIRDWGLWDITGLTLSPKTHYHLFGLYPNLPGSEVQTVFTQERARQVKETEHRLEALQTEFEKLQKERDEAMNQIRDQDSSITSKQAEIDNLLRRIEQIESEKGEIKRKLEDTQDTLTQTINTANAIPRIDQAAHDAEMNELFKELRSLKQDLHVACTERQNAMSEASTLKAEMSQRLLEMSQMKNLLVSIQLETETTRGRVQDVQIKQDQLATLQEQVKMYQEKYEDARAMLNNKTDMIENLQQQMDQLHEKLQKMSRNVDHWVSRKKEESSDTDSSFDKAPAGHKQGHSQGQGDDWCQNNNMTSNTHISHIPKSIEAPQTNTVSAEELEKLNARILSLESQCKSKDTLLQSLECELNVEKDFKKRIQAEMASREAEVTMQKAIQLTTISATLNNQMISTHFDMKNNTLLRQCYDLLTKIEPDYLQENQAMGRGTSDWVASSTSYEDTDVENLRVMLKGSKMEAVLTAIIDENKELKEKLGEEIKHSGNLQNELNLNKSSRADEMASQLHNLISTLEHENSQLKSEINNLTGNCSDSSVRSSTSPKNAEVDFQADILKRDEMIRLQKQQIQNFEEYIQRLHTEIKQWTNTTSNQSVVPESENGSIIAHLQENIKQFQEFSKAKTERHLELMMVIKTIKQELQNSRKREIELKSDNQMLHQTVATLNVKLADLIKSFERLQYQFGSPHMSAWASMEFSDTSDGIQNGNHDLHSISTTPENQDVSIINLQSPAVAGRSFSRAPFIPRNCSTPREESVTKHQHLIREYNFYYDETVKITRCCHEPLDLRTNTI